jgi:hypothetical protein
MQWASSAFKSVYALHCVREISNSSTLFPDLSCALPQRGCFPRPDQVSSGLSGLRLWLNFPVGSTRIWFILKATLELNQPAL